MPPEVAEPSKLELTAYDIGISHNTPHGLLRGGPLSNIQLSPFAEHVLHDFLQSVRRYKGGIEEYFADHLSPDYSALERDALNDERKSFVNAFVEQVKSIPEPEFVETARETALALTRRFRYMNFDAVVLLGIAAHEVVSGTLPSQNKELY